MSKMKLYITLFLVFTSTIYLSAQSVDDVLNSINYQTFYRHLSYFASDELRGRGFGTANFDKAANYVANDFKTHNLIPFGDNGNYFQNINFVKRGIVDSTVVLNFNFKGKKISGICGNDFNIHANMNIDKVDATYKLVFVGYGEIDESEKINDYNVVDVKGKVVIIALGKVDGTGSLYQNLVNKIDNAKKNGAIGAIFYLPYEKGIILDNYNTMRKFYSQTFTTFEDTSLSVKPFKDDLDFAIFANKEFVNKILQSEKINLSSELTKIKSGSNRSKELKSSLKIVFNVENKIIKTENIVGLLPGTDSILKNEYIVVSAHLDHLGVGEPVNGDSIYNGMWDNASGSAALLTLAKAFYMLNEKPKRSIIFVAFTGEEEGLWGSLYFTKYNNVKNGKIVANLNIDLVGSLLDTKDLMALGYNHSNLSEAVDYSFNKLNIIRTEDKSDKDNRMLRSDQFPFVMKGIPVIVLIWGYISTDSNVNMHQEREKWDENIYHTPSDDLNQKFSPDEFVKGVKANFLTLYYMAYLMDEIKWNENSKYYKKYVLKQKKQ